MATIATQRATQNASYCQNSTMRPFRQKTIRPAGRTKPLRNRNRAATDAAHDLCELLDKNAGAARSIYGSKGHTPARDYGYQNGHTNRIPVRNKHQTQQQPTACYNTSRYSGAAHPLCFTEEVLDHEFPQGFKPVNIEAYEGTTDPGVWIEDFILHIHTARGTTSTPSNTLPSS